MYRSKSPPLNTTISITPSITKSTKSETKSEAANEICAICLDPVNHPASLPACGHTFCHECLAAYLKGLFGTGAAGAEAITVFAKCPLCRAPSCVIRSQSGWRLIENHCPENSSKSRSM